MKDHIIIELSHPSGETLNTKGRYCDKDIYVAPKLEEIEVVPQMHPYSERTLYPHDGYAGIGRVIVQSIPANYVEFLPEKTSTAEYPVGSRIIKGEFVGMNAQMQLVPVSEGVTPIGIALSSGNQNTFIQVLQPSIS